MEFTYYSHFCFLTRVNSKNLLFDPCITANPLAGKIDFSIIEADYIFLSH